MVVTRSGPRARDLIDAVQRAGAQAVEVPLTTQTEPHDGSAALRAAAREVGSFRWVVLTSVNAVSRFMGELRDARALGATLVAAVGPATADALRSAGVEPDLVPTEHSASGLTAAFPLHDAGSPGNRVLFPCADGAPSTVPDALLEKGWEVERVEAYRTVSLAPPSGPLLERVTRADAVVFAAASSVEAFAALRGPDGTPLAVPPLVVCIGPTTAERARALGMSGVEAGRGDSAGEHRRGAHPSSRRARRRRTVGWRDGRPLLSRAAVATTPAHPGSPEAGGRGATGVDDLIAPCSCARGSTARCRSRRCPGRSSTPSTRWWWRRSAWSHSASPG